MRNSRKGQGMLEYTLLMGAVIAVLVVVLLGLNGKGGMKLSIEEAYTKTGDAMKSAATDLTTNAFKP